MDDDCVYGPLSCVREGNGGLCHRAPVLTLGDAHDRVAAGNQHAVFLCGSFHGTHLCAVALHLSRTGGVQSAQVVRSGCTVVAVPKKLCVTPAIDHRNCR